MRLGRATRPRRAGLLKSLLKRLARVRGRGLAVIAAMSEADAENSRLSSKRPFGSFHLLRDHR
jgi:hypothetical protein